MLPHWHALPPLSSVSTIAKPVEARPGSIPMALIRAVIYKSQSPHPMHSEHGLRGRNIMVRGTLSTHKKTQSSNKIQMINYQHPGHLNCSSRH